MPAQHAPSDHCEQTWVKVVTAFREVCILRKQERTDQAKALLEKELPGLIALWSQASPDEVATKRRNLEAMFKTEEKRIEEAWMLQRLVATRLTEELVPNLRSEISQEIKQAVGEHLARLPKPEAPARSPRAFLPPQPASGHRPVPLRGAPPRLARVPLEDIPGMIDAALAADRSAPLRAAAK